MKYTQDSKGNDNQVQLGEHRKKKKKKDGYNYQKNKKHKVMTRQSEVRCVGP